MNLLDAIRMELSQLDPAKLPPELRAPNLPLEKGEKVVGEVEPDTRPLFILSRVWAKMAMEIIIEARFSGKSQQTRELVAKASELQKKSEILMEIFWASLRDAHGLWDDVIVAVRAGWQVVVCEPEEPPFLKRFRELLGG